MDGIDYHQSDQSADRLSVGNHCNRSLSFTKSTTAVEPLVSYGRMGLTNYIVQSVAGVFIFSGFGLDWSHLGVFLSVLVCLAYTGIQIAISHYWLKGFRYGPMEWLWRTGTYMKWQPLVR